MSTPSRSTRPGAAATLPGSETVSAAPANAEHGPASSVHPAEKGAARPLVLVVEDELHDWQIYGKILWYNGYDVLHAPDGDEGLRLAQRYLPDLVLLDIMLPKRDGLELCREIKEDAATRGIPVLALSGRAAREFEAPARQVGCTGYLEKPISPAEVVREVARVIGPAPASGIGRRPRRFSPMEDAAIGRDAKA